VELRSIAAGTFDASHRIDGYDPCRFPHGHSWVIEVAVGGDLDPDTGEVRGAAPLADALEAWCTELDNGDLDGLLPGVVTSPLGIATAALDALALRFPRIASVRVACSNGLRGEVSRTPRQL